MNKTIWRESSRFFKFFGPVILLVVIWAALPPATASASHNCTDPHEWSIRSGGSAALGGLVVKTYIQRLDGTQVLTNYNMTLTSSTADGIARTNTGPTAGQSIVSSSASLNFSSGSTFWRSEGNLSPCTAVGYTPFGYGTAAANGNRYNLKTGAGATDFRVDVANTTPTTYGHWESRVESQGSTGDTGWKFLNTVVGGNRVGVTFKAAGGTTTWNTIRWVEQAPPVSPNSTPNISGIYNCDGVTVTASDPNSAGPVRIHTFSDGPVGTGTFYDELIINPTVFRSRDSIPTLKGKMMYVYAIDRETGGYSPYIAGNVQTDAACQRPPSGSINTANCNLVKVTATDPDNSATQLTVRLFVNGWQVASGVTSGPSHEITFNYDASWEPYRDTDTHTVRVEAQNVDSAGAASGGYVPIGTSSSVGPCYSSTCNSLSVNGGNPVEAGVAFPVSVTFNNSGEVAWSASTPDPVVRLAITDSTTGTSDNSSDWSLSAAVPPPNTTENGANGKRHVKLDSNVAVNTTRELKFMAKTNSAAAVNNNLFYPRLVYEKSPGVTIFFGGACSGGTFDSHTRFNITATNTNLTLNNDETPTTAYADYAVEVTGGPVIATRTNKIFKLNASGIEIAPTFSGPTSVSESQTTRPVRDPAVGIVGIYGVQPGESVCGSISISPATGLVKSNGVVVSSSGSTSPPPKCTQIGDKSYFRVYNGDVAVGFGKDAGSCPVWFPESTYLPNTNSKLTAWNDEAGKGAGVQLASLVLGTIKGFTSATGRSVDPPIPPKGLTFTNTVADTYGGSFEGPGFCAPDYFDSAYKDTIEIENGQIPTPSMSREAPSKTRVGDVTITSSSSDRISGTVSLYVDGDVYIKDNIIYDTNPWDINNIPKFSLVAKGNIYIDKGVGQLDGVYIAQPKSRTEGGKIYTCATDIRRLPSVVNPPPDDIYTVCNKKLTINGLFIAKQVKLLRTKGTLSTSVGGNAEVAGSDNIAESFMLSPESWLVKPGGILGAGANGTYDTIDNPPPVL